MLRLLGAITKILFFSSYSGGFINPLDIFLLFQPPSATNERLIYVRNSYSNRSSRDFSSPPKYLKNVTLWKVMHYFCNVTYVVPLPISLEITHRNQKILKSTEIRSIHLILLNEPFFSHGSNENGSNENVIEW